MSDEDLPSFRRGSGFISKSPNVMPGASSVPINPALGANYRHAGQVNRNPSDKPNKYTQMGNANQQTVIGDVNLDNNWFSPFQPIDPFGPPFVDYPRTYDYDVGQNIDFLPSRVSFFGTLRAMSYSWGVLRAVIETRKDQLLKVTWTIRLRDKPKQKNKRSEELNEFFVRPDRKNKFDPWVRKLLEDLFVIDAPSAYVWRNNGGKPYAIDVIDGATIKPLIDDAGRRPDYPSPAFQQIIKGLPMIDLDETELIYAPMRPRTSLPIYGYSPVEQIFIEVTEGIRKQLYRAAFWNEGTLPDLIITVPESWSPQQTASFQGMFDAMLSGNLSFKSKVRFVPGGMKPFDIKNADGQGLKAERDEDLTRLVCYAFSISPQPFVRMMNRATAQSAQEEAEEEGLQPLMRWFKSEIMDPIVQEDIGFGYDDCEFAWTPEPEVDQQKQMMVLTGYVKAGLKTPDEARDEINLPPLPDGAGKEAIVETATGPVPLAETVEANRQRALSVPDELDRQQESHDVSIQGQKKSNQQIGKPDPNAAPPNKKKKGKGVGKFAGAPFRENLSALESCIHGTEVHRNVGWDRKV